MLTRRHCHGLSPFLLPSCPLSGLGGGPASQPVSAHLAAVWSLHPNPRHAAHRVYAVRMRRLKLRPGLDPTLLTHPPLLHQPTARGRIHTRLDDTLDSSAVWWVASVASTERRGRERGGQKGVPVDECDSESRTRTQYVIKLAQHCGSPFPPSISPSMVRSQRAPPPLACHQAEASRTPNRCLCLPALPCPALLCSPTCLSTTTTTTPPPPQSRPPSPTSASPPHCHHHHSFSTPARLQSLPCQLCCCDSD